MIDAALEKLAQAHDIQTSYEDLQGRRITANPQSVLAALRVMGVLAVAADAATLLRLREKERWHWHVEPVIVAWEGEGQVVCRMPAGAQDGVALLRIEIEGGSAIEETVRWHDARVLQTAEVGGDACVEVAIKLPRLPLGYHELALESGGRRLQALVIAAPLTAYSAGGERRWGVFMPLYALNSRRSWGIGDYTDFRRLIEWAGDRGAAVVATLPLLPTFLDEPFEPSPYQPVSRLFWNEVFVDPEGLLPGGTGRAVDGSLAEKARGLTGSVEVDYAAVMALKREAMEQQAASLPPPVEMQAYLSARPEVTDYARFRAAIERLGLDWRLWPAGARDGELCAGDYDDAVVRYYEFAQWRAHSQMIAAGAAAARRGMRSYLDLPVGVHGQGYDAWRYRELFAQGMTVGAPPDLLSANGQNWGFQPLLPERHRATGYAYMARYLRHYFVSAKMLRIDHAIGLHRLYWIPEGATGRDGVFVRQPAEELYAVLCLESVRNEAVVIGEDLGLVPPEVSEGLKRHGISSMYVQMFEMTGDAARPMNPPPTHSVASFSTHDLPPFCAYWQDADLAQRERLGLLPPSRVEEERERRRQDRAALVGNLGERGLVRDGSDTAEVFMGSTALLAESDAEWLVLNLEDTWGETRAQNLPGTSNDQHANWVARAAHAFDEFDSLDGLTETVSIVRGLRPPNTDHQSREGA